MDDSQVMQSYQSRYTLLRRVDSPCIVLFAGLPGSGKTTHAAALEAELPAVRLASDDIKESIRVGGQYHTARMFALQNKLIHYFMGQGVHIIIDSNCDKEWIRRQHIETASRYGYQPQIIYLHCPLAQLPDRMDTRNSALPAIRRHRVDAATLARHAAEFEVPEAQLTLDTTQPFVTTRNHMMEYFRGL